jgi:hypothetical protein
MLYLHFTNHANQPEFFSWKNFSIALQKIWYLDDFVKLCTCFKGSLTWDFRVHIFSWISFSWAPEFPIGAIANFLRKFAEIYLARTIFRCLQYTVWGVHNNLNMSCRWYADYEYNMDQTSTLKKNHYFAMVTFRYNFPIFPIDTLITLLR